MATHGPPNDTNAHPHLDQTGKIALVHNGIIGNYSSIKMTLEGRGIKFTSDTDRSLVHILNYIIIMIKSFENVKSTLQEVVGAYGIVAICVDEPEKMVAARIGSPLVLGVGDGEYLLASDASPIIDYTRNVIYLEDDEREN